MAYFPFGGGPRICIGNMFAMMESVLILATIASRWSMKLVPGHPIGLSPVFTLAAANGHQGTSSRKRRRQRPLRKPVAGSAGART